MMKGLAVGLTPGLTVGIVANAGRDSGLAYANAIAAELRARGCTAVINEEDAYSCRFLIVLGGDGTMLRASHFAAEYNTPMLGINLGTLGYLTDVDHHEGFSAIEKMLAGDFLRERRMMLETRGKLALNDVIIRRESSSKLMTFDIHVNGKLMDSLRADGVIVSTPTGSTAYNLSAGGPILRPDSEMTVITAICPHTLYTRPWVISGSDTVSLNTAGIREDKALVSLDGDDTFHLECGEPITVRRSQHVATVIRTSGLDFFEVLRKKMAK